MKSSDFKRHSTTLRTLQEEPRKKKFNWDRWIYIGLLSIGAMLLVRFIILKVFVVKADGHVRFHKLDVMFTQDIQVLKFYVEPGEEICAGDTLFKFILDEDIDHGNGGIGSGGGNITNDINLLKEDTKWAERERLVTLKKIQSNEIDKKFKTELIDQINTQIEGLKKEIYLNIQTSEKLNPLYNKIAELQSEIKVLNSEISFLYNYLEWLKSQEPSSVDLNIVSNPANNFQSLGVGAEDFSNYYISPIDGTITHIFIEEFEVALESQQVLSIHIPENIFIRAYFSQSDLDQFEVNDFVDIKFPDGTKTEGYIKRIYSASYEIPEEFQKKYEPVTRTIAADIYPVNAEELKKWKKYYRIGVQVTKARFW